MFSSKEKFITFIGIAISSAAVNVTWYYSQDAFISFSVHFIIFFLVPIIIGKMLNNNLYISFNYKDIIEKYEGKKILFLLIWIGISTVLIIGSFIFSWVNLGSHLIVQAPHFQYLILNVLYGVVTLAVMLLALNQEFKLYYGIFVIMVPGGILEYLIMAVIQTSHWIGFSLRFFSNHESIYLYLGILFVFFFSLAYLRNLCGFGKCKPIYLAFAGYNYLFILLIGLFAEKGFFKSNNITSPNPGNVWNRI